MAGARVVGVARRRAELEEWSASTEGETAVVTADLADRSRLADVIAAVNEPFGPPTSSSMQPASIPASTPTR